MDYYSGPYSRGVTVSMWTVQPKEVQERHARFLKFKEDIEKRLQQWLEDHPESADTPRPKWLLPSASPLPDQTTTSSFAPTGRISVLPSTYLDGGWVVWMDGFIVQSYYGRDSHDKAQKLATGLANGDISPDDPSLHV